MEHPVDTAMRSHVDAEILRESQRLMATEILFEGRSYMNHVAHVTAEGRFSLTPFAEETPSTLFISGRVEVEFNPAERRIRYRRYSSVVQDS